MTAGRLLRQALLQQIRIAGTQSRTTIGAPGHVLQVCIVDSQAEAPSEYLLCRHTISLPQADLISLHTRQFCSAQAHYLPGAQQLKSAWPQNQVPSQLQHLRYGNLPSLPRSVWLRPTANSSLCKQQQCSRNRAYRHCCGFDMQKHLHQSSCVCACDRQPCMMSEHHA